MFTMYDYSNLQVVGIFVFNEYKNWTEN